MNIFIIKQTIIGLLLERIMLTGKLLKNLIWYLMRKINLI